MLRRRKKAVEIVRGLDTFTKTSSKTPEELVEKSGIGGTLTIIGACITVWMFTSEVYTFFYHKNLKFQFLPDTAMDEKLKLNVDITVAMPCPMIGADAVDSVGEWMADSGTLNEQDTKWELSDTERMNLENTRMLNTYLTEEFHAVQKLLYQSSYISFLGALGIENEDDSLSPGVLPNACRISGTLNLNKFSGNFHITAGKAFPLPDDIGSHIHLAMIPNHYVNFSHRIRHFSFGSSTTGVVHPLDGEEKISTEGLTMYQYFTEVVPVDVELGIGGSTTGYQLSVKEQARVINHAGGSHGMAGIYFKYSMSPVRVKVTSGNPPVLTFFIGLFSTIAGIAITFGIIRNFFGWINKIMV